MSPRSCGCRSARSGDGRWYCSATAAACTSSPRFIDRLGNWLAGGPGIACLAIDLPFHGDRTPADEIGLSALERRHLLGLDGWRERNAGATGQAVADWRAAMDGAQDRDRMPHGPIGYFGVSMGTRFGVPLIAAEPRIAVAVLGLFGVPAADTESAFARAARQVTIPVLFLQQWDDELFPRDDCLALFDLLGSPDKTLHANPGGHLGIPADRVRPGGPFPSPSPRQRQQRPQRRGPGEPGRVSRRSLLRPPGPFARRRAMG